MIIYFEIRFKLLLNHRFTKQPMIKTFKYNNLLNKKIVYRYRNSTIKPFNLLLFSRLSFKLFI